MKKRKIGTVILLCGVLVCAIAAALLIAKWAANQEQEVDRNEIVTVWCISEVWSRRPGKEKKLAYNFKYDAYGNMLSQSIYWSEIYNQDTSVYRYEFDDRGNLTRCYDGEWLVKAYTYDERDNVLTEIEYGYDGEEWIRYVYTYDAQNRVLTHTKFMNGEQSWEDVNTYDSRGNLTRTETIIDGEVSNTNIYTYDQAGRILISKYDDILDPRLSSESYYQYDARGNEISQKRYQNGKLRTEKTHTYDFFNRMKTEKTVEGGYTEHEATYFYDWEGKLIREESMQRMSLVGDTRGELELFVLTYRYDQYGNMIEKVTESERMGTNTYTWLYDAKGNLLVEEHGEWRTERTYDEWGNILTKCEYNSSGTKIEVEYSYISFQVPRWLAEKISAWQQDFVDKNGYV